MVLNKESSALLTKYLEDRKEVLIYFHDRKFLKKEEGYSELNSLLISQINELNLSSRISAVPQRISSHTICSFIAFMLDNTAYANYIKGDLMLPKVILEAYSLYNLHIDISK